MCTVIQSKDSHDETFGKSSTTSVDNRDHYFALAFVNLFQKLNRDDGVDMFDSHRVGEISYTTVYDAIKIAFPTVRV